MAPILGKFGFAIFVSTLFLSQIIRLERRATMLIQSEIAPPDYGDFSKV
jgi:hypothetical protein